jgi:dTMP kinase
MLLYMASRAQLVSDVIRPALEAGRVVVCDRFLLANVVYQGHAGGLDVERLWQVGQLATGGLEPDLTFVLDISAADAARRIRRAPDRMERLGPDYLERVREGFLAEAARRPEKIAVIDATADEETVQQAVRSAAQHLLDAGDYKNSK